MGFRVARLAQEVIMLHLLETTEWLGPFIRLEALIGRSQAILAKHLHFVGRAQRLLSESGIIFTSH